MKNPFSLFKLMLFAIFIAFMGCKEEKTVAEVAEPAQQNDFKIIAYYTPSTNKLDDETINKLDQIIYSFLHLKGNELFVGAVEDSTSLAYLTSLKKQNPKLKVLVSLGGWGGCETCSDVFSTPQGREDFSKSVKDILDTFNADGIDLDWEYPVIEGFPGHTFKPEDKENCTALVEKLRETLGDEPLISFAAGGFDDYLEQAVEWEKVMPLLDNVNLMTYDMVNGGSSTTGHHSSLYSTSQQPNSSDGVVNFLDSIGVPREKMILGAAFYARTWEDVDSLSNGLYQKGNFKSSVLYKDLEKFEKENLGFKKYWDTTARAPYSYNAEKKLFATYDDSLSIAEKTKYVINKDLGGIMFWQLSGDKTEDGLLDVIYNTIKKH